MNQTLLDSLVSVTFQVDQPEKAGLEAAGVRNEDMGLGTLGRFEHGVDPAQGHWPR